jgi:diguanylate cyclase (GGDEF)-like protein/PAS domain S-box-containing protein
MAGLDVTALLPLRPLAAVAAAGAVLSLLGGSVTGAGAARMIVDGLVASTSLLFLSWTPVLSPLYERAETGWDALTGLVAPTGDLVLVAVLFAAGARVPRSQRRPWALLAGGVCLLAIGDGALAYARLAPVMSVGGIKELAWMAAFVLIGIAACSPEASHTPLAQEPRPTRAFGVLVPYAPFVIAVAEGVSRAVQGRLDNASMILGGVLGGLLFARQLLAQFETLEITRHLDRLVRDRTKELHDAEQKFRSLVQNASDVLIVADADGVVRYVSAACRRVLGASPGSLVGIPFASTLHGEDIDRVVHQLSSAEAPPAPPILVEARMRHTNGSWVAVDIRASDLAEEPGVRGLLLTVQDVTARQELQQRLRHDALHDPLTGLGNRVLFQDRLQHAVARSAREPQTLAVLMLDLDGFKDVNDTLGHAAGDRLLVSVAERLQAAVRPSDTVSRMGGDEFAVLIERAEPNTAELIASRILARLRAPLEIDGRNLVPNGSIGVALASTEVTDPEALLRAADLAMYRAKTDGKGRFELFEEGMQEAALERVELEADFRRALRNEEFVLHFQPVVELPSGRVAGAEALVRWQHPSRGLLPPGEFIPLAEQSDLIVDLGRWVLRSSVEHAKAFQEQFPSEPPFSVAVNIASRQLTTPWLVEEVERVVREVGIDPRSLTLEITEGALMSESTPIEPTLQALRDLGVKLAIDDFGTGWSSLSRLRAFPVDCLKVDRAFVSEIKSPDDEVPLVAAIIAMAHSLDLHVVAEGVETLDQLACLHGLGCDEVQGYLLSRPLTRERLEEFLAAPTGFLDGPEAVSSSAADGRTPEERAFMGVVASATAATADESITDSVLDELQRVSGMDVVFLVSTDPDTGAHEVVRVARHRRLGLRAGMVWDGLDRRGSGRSASGRHVIPDLNEVAPGHVLAEESGVRGYLSVPVHAPDGRAVGALCGASAERLPATESLGILFELFASLVTQHLAEPAMA